MENGESLESLTVRRLDVIKFSALSTKNTASASDVDLDYTKN